MQRYGIINEKNPREIVLLRGSGCVYKKCSFCDYHLDKCSDEAENFALNSSALSKVTGQYGDLEVINSGSVFELDEKTLALISETCHQKNIHTIHFEAHYLFRKRIPEIRERFGDIMLKMKLGLETFDYDLRENCLNKGIPEKNPAVIVEYFDEANFIFGLTGQNVETMKRDISLGLKYFERICVNIMTENTTPIKPDKKVVDLFLKYVYPEIKDNERIDILIQNTDFGVGGEDDE